MHTFGPLVVVEPRTMAPVAGQTATVTDMTGQPVATYDMQGNPRPVVTNGRGHVGQFQAGVAFPPVTVPDKFTWTPLGGGRVRLVTAYPGNSFHSWMFPSGTPDTAGTATVEVTFRTATAHTVTYSTTGDDGGTSGTVTITIAPEMLTPDPVLLRLAFHGGDVVVVPALESLRSGVDGAQLTYSTVAPPAGFWVDPTEEA